MEKALFELLETVDLDDMDGLEISIYYEALPGDCEEFVIHTNKGNMVTVSRKYVGIPDDCSVQYEGVDEEGNEYTYFDWGEHGEHVSININDMHATVENECVFTTSI